jgi:Rab GDP dissociation inhibitor
MDEEYDVVVIGTGLTECILSGLLSIEKKKVLHMDRNNYYGGECASLNLSQLFQRFRKNQKAPESLGRDRDYNVDLVPKFIMADSELVKILTHTDVTRYLEFKQISGSFVFRDGSINKVPVTALEALSSPMFGFFEKRRAKSFFEFLQNYKFDNPETQQGLNLNVCSMTDVYKKFGLEAGTQDYIGHALALFQNDQYLTKPAKHCYDRIMLYMRSLARYGKSPYIYPLYGLGELPQGFARLSAIYGGTYMLDKNVDELVVVDGKVCGVKCGEEVVKCKAVICDPSYALSRCKKVGQVVRVLCLLKNAIPNTGDVDSAQIIIPQNQVGRKHDIYVACVSFSHNVCAKGYWLAIVSTIVETANPEAEVQAGLNLLGQITEKFVSITDIYEPLSDGRTDGIFITKSYDSTSHFDTVTDDLKSVYKRYSGKDLTIEKVRGSVEEEQQQQQQQ